MIKNIFNIIYLRTIERRGFTAPGGDGTMAALAAEECP